MVHCGSLQKKTSPYYFSDRVFSPFSQLFKGKFFVCQGEDTRNITNRSDCAEANYKWIRHKYNFDNLGQVLMER